jgi:hypothetical protein
MRGVQAQQGAHFGPTYLALVESRFQLTKALCADFLSQPTGRELLNPAAKLVPLQGPRAAAIRSASLPPPLERQGFRSAARRQNFKGCGWQENLAKGTLDIQAGAKAEKATRNPDGLLLLT